MDSLPIWSYDKNKTNKIEQKVRVTKPKIKVYGKRKIITNYDNNFNILPDKYKTKISKKPKK